MALTAVEIRNAKAQDKPYKLSDEKGLYLLVTTAGKYWRFDYRFESKRKTLALGVYPDVQLAGHKDRESGLWIDGARDKRDNARRLLANGTDPGTVRKAQKSARADRAVNSFERIGREWFATRESGWEASHSSKILSRLERDVFPWLGDRPVVEITGPEILTVLRRIEDRGANESAHRALQYINRIFRYAISSARVERNPAADLSSALKPVQTEHFGAITQPKAVGELLRVIDAYQGRFVTKCALSLAPLVFVRPGELRKAEWKEFDLDNAAWTIPPERLKVRGTAGHLVPLSAQALGILRELQPLTGAGQYVFPSAHGRGRPMSENTITGALRRLGYSGQEMTGHGFRAMARTILDEVLQIRPDYIEHQLAHAVRDPNGRAYNRTAHLAERRKMMQAWADYLDSLKAGAEVVPLRGHAA